MQNMVLILKYGFKIRIFKILYVCKIKINFYYDYYYVISFLFIFLAKYDPSSTGK